MLLITGSRAGIVAAGFLVAMGVQSRWKHTSGWQRAAILLAALSLVWRISEDQGRVTLGPRLDIVRAALPTLREHWIRGVGWANTPQYVTTATDGVVFHLHLLPLHLLFETGVSGLIGWSAVNIWVFMRCRWLSYILTPAQLTDAGVFLNAGSMFFVGVLVGYFVSQNLRRGETRSSPNSLDIVEQNGQRLRSFSRRHELWSYSLRVCAHRTSGNLEEY
jgi:O-antigen ligase